MLVVGGGLAGITAALDLADKGFAVTLAERRNELGGRLFSFLSDDGRTQLDNGQHVFMRCCERFIALLDRLGVTDKTFLQPNLALRVYNRAGRYSTLGSLPLRAPLHLLPSLLSYRHLSFLEKVRAVQALVRIRAMSAQTRRDLDHLSFAEWLRANRQSEKAIKVFWELVTTPTLNQSVERSGCSMAFKVFQTAFLQERNGADLGYARVPLGELIGRPARARLESAGVQVLLAAAVERFEVEGERVLARVGAASLEADACILALPFQALPALLATVDCDGLKLPALETSPIINVHLWLDREVIECDFVAVVESPLQFVFNRNRMMRSPDWEGHYLDVSISAAEKLIGLSDQEIVRIISSELRQVFPAAAEAVILKRAVVRQRHATFSPSPGILRERLPLGSSYGPFFLAGDWVDTDWPATMEGAVRSGEAAAHAAVSYLRTQADWVASRRTVSSS